VAGRSTSRAASRPTCTSSRVSKVDWVQIPESAAAFDVFYKVDELWPRESLERIHALGTG
jgi:hypothetical protein